MIYDIAMEFAYTAVELDSPITKEYLQTVSLILKENNIDLPKYENIWFIR